MKTSIKLPPGYQVQVGLNIAIDASTAKWDGIFPGYEIQAGDKWGEILFQAEMETEQIPPSWWKYMGGLNIINWNMFLKTPMPVRIIIFIVPEVQQRTLLFGNPVFNDGPNVTVRNGTKWADQVEVGDIVSVAKTDDPDFEMFEAKILEIRTATWDEFPEKYLEWEHDPKCKTVESLRTEMIERYMTPLSNDVTILMFEQV